MWQFCNTTSWNAAPSYDRASIIFINGFGHSLLFPLDRLYILITICHWYLRCAAFFPISWEHSKSFLGLHHHHQNLFVAAKIFFFPPVSFSYFILHADKEMGTEHMFLPHAATKILSKGTNISVICWSDSRSFFELGALVMFEWFIRQG